MHGLSATDRNSIPRQRLRPRRQVSPDARHAENYVKTAESGNKRAQAFCAECGSPIYATSVGDDGPKSYGIRVGTAHQRAELTPKRQVWHRSAVPWLPELEGVATREKG